MLARWLRACVRMLWVLGNRYPQPPQPPRDRDIPIVPEYELLQTLLGPAYTPPIPPKSVYHPTRFEQEMAEAAAKYGIAIVTAEQQACPCVHRVGRC